MRQSTYLHPHTFEEAKQWLAEPGNHIDYEVKVGRHSGALMTRETWLESVADRSFIDYDGMGNEIDVNGNVLGEAPGNPAWIKPSEAADIRPETAYILWYNR